MKVENAQETKKRRRFGFHRWLIVLLIILNVIVVGYVSPILPHIQVPAETVTHLFGNFYLTNTMIAALIGDFILILLAICVYRASRRREQIFTGIPAVIELVLEAIYNLVESTAGKRARRIFPWVATIILVVLVANWLELIPGVDSIGLLHEVEAGQEGYPVKEILPGLLTIVEKNGADVSQGKLYGLIPFVRAASTDLNFTAALAVVSVLMTQLIGVQALGPGYFTKFLNFRGAARMWVKENVGVFDVIMPILDIFVGLLELVTEFAKVLSFSFRLFGNLFAGSVLLFVLGSLVPVFVQSGVVLFEFFVGVIQALVFGMLTMVFMTMAAHGHEGHG
jgi:F-type H+-transporting ATPase subunit a